jgi:hypothetical protein
MPTVEVVSQLFNGLDRWIDWRSYFLECFLEKHQRKNDLNWEPSLTFKFNQVPACENQWSQNFRGIQGICIHTVHAYTIKNQKECWNYNAGVVEHIAINWRNGFTCTVCAIQHTIFLSPLQIHLRDNSLSTQWLLISMVVLLPQDAVGGWETGLHLIWEELNWWALHSQTVVDGTPQRGVTAQRYSTLEKSEWSILTGRYSAAMIGKNPLWKERASVSWITRVLLFRATHPYGYRHVLAARDLSWHHLTFSQLKSGHGF